MEDQWRHIIENNRELFEADEPEDGHYERFRKKLYKKTLYIRFWPAAAVVIILLLAANQIRMYLQTPEIKREALLAGNPEYREAEIYYTSSIREGMEKLEYLSGENILTEKEQKIMEEEMKEFQESFDLLFKELKANPEDERIINAIIETYRARLNIINMIISKLEEIKHSKESTQST